MTDTTAQLYQLLIRSSPERVWEAIVRPEFTRRYFFGVHVDTTAAVGTPKAAARASPPAAGSFDATSTGRAG